MCYKRDGRALIFSNRINRYSTRAIANDGNLWVFEKKNKNDRTQRSGRDNYCCCVEYAPRGRESRGVVTAPRARTFFDGRKPHSAETPPFTWRRCKICIKTNTPNGRRGGAIVNCVCRVTAAVTENGNGHTAPRTAHESDPGPEIIKTIISVYTTRVVWIL